MKWDEKQAVYVEEEIPDITNASLASERRANYQREEKFRTFLLNELNAIQDAIIELMRK